jgi:hypothetical protein
MKSAEAYLDLVDKGLSPARALSSLPQCELQYIDKVPIGVFFAAQYLGWKFFPRFLRVSHFSPSWMKRSRIAQATSDTEQLKRWARTMPQWALATGSPSGLVVLVLDGDAGRNSLLELCKDDWDWLFTLRTQAGVKRYIFFTWPQDEERIPVSSDLGKGMSILGEDDWLLFPPSREFSGAQHVFLTRAIAAVAPPWLRDLVRKSESASTLVPAPSQKCSSQVCQFGT